MLWDARSVSYVVAVNADLRPNAETSKRRVELLALLPPTHREESKLYKSRSDTRIAGQVGLSKQGRMYYYVHRVSDDNSLSLLPI